MGRKFLWRFRAGAVALAAAAWLLSLAAAEPANALTSEDLVHTHLYAATLQAGEAALADRIAADPQDGNASFGLGLLRFAHAVEHLSRSLYRHGLRAPKQFGVPVLRLPVPENPSPEALSYEDFRGVLRDFVSDLRAADAALADVGGRPVALALDVGQIRIDIVGDGGKSEAERLWTLFAGLEPGFAAGQTMSGDVVLDRGDVAWLRGYCHLLMGFAEAWLGYDFHETFEETFGLFFPRAGLAESFSREDDRARNGYTGLDIEIADAVSMIHLIHWPVAEPQRLRDAREDLLQVIAMSRASWAAVMARTDKGKRRWLPGPGERGIFAGLQVTSERVAAWMNVLADAEAVLEGRKLVPHWRFTKGINLAKVFTEPRPFDLVLWITGPGARPYLESGEMIGKESSAQIDHAFGGDFLTYAFWFN